MCVVVCVVVCVCVKHAESVPQDVCEQEGGRVAFLPPLPAPWNLKNKEEKQKQRTDEKQTRGPYSTRASAHTHTHTDGCALQKMWTQAKVRFCPSILFSELPYPLLVCVCGWLGVCERRMCVCVCVCESESRARVWLCVSRRRVE